MNERDFTLPDFENPPVDETVLSLQFAPIPNFGAPHFGLYWARIRSDFPHFQVHPPVASVMEQFESAFRGLPRFGIQLTSQPDLRCWFLDPTDTRLIQVQTDRFIHNWRRVTGKEKYPRYPSVRETLRAEWVRFCEFLESEGFAIPQVNQCEVSYINQIEYGTSWPGYAELDKVIGVWASRNPGMFLPSPERANLEVHYLLPDKLGRLHISVEPVIRARDTQEVLQISLTARGAPKSPALEDTFHWLDLGREWVVKGFADFTTPIMHQLWGRTV